MGDNEIIMKRRMPEKYKSCGLGGVPAGEAWDTIRRYEAQLSKQRPTVGIVLAGPNGVGKSGAMAVLHKEANCKYPHWASRHLMWANARDIALSYGYYKTDIVFDEDVDSLYESAKWLVVDELGKESDIRNFDRRMQSLLRCRSENNVVTHFTTNLSLEENENDQGTVLGLYGKSFWSLLHETCILVSVDGEDRRRGG